MSDFLYNSFVVVVVLGDDWPLSLSPCYTGLCCYLLVQQPTYPLETPHIHATSRHWQCKNHVGTVVHVGRGAGRGACRSWRHLAYVAMPRALLAPLQNQHRKAARNGHMCCMGFVWVHAESFLHSLASPFHSFVTTLVLSTLQASDALWLMRATVRVDFAVHATAYELIRNNNLNIQVQSRACTCKSRGGPCTGPPSPCARNAPHAAFAHSTLVTRSVTVPVYHRSQGPKTFALKLERQVNFSIDPSRALFEQVRESGSVNSYNILSRPASRQLPSCIYASCVLSLCVCETRWLAVCMHATPYGVCVGEC